jgi:membrane protease subunit HflK
MAWNEPGDGNQKPQQDPWRRPSKNQGPPDLDALLQEMLAKLNRLLQGKKTSGGGAGSASTPDLPSLLMLAGAVLFALWLVSGVYRVEEAEQAVVLRFGEFNREESAGLHWYPRFVETINKVNTQRVIGHRHTASMLTEDQNIVDMELEVQYRVANPRRYFLDIAAPESALKEATESALRQVVGGAKMESIITEGRVLIAQDVQLRLKEFLDRYKTGLMITKVSIEDAHPPEQVKAAFDDVIKAREDEERLKDVARKYENKVLPEANGHAKRLLEEAQAHQQEVVAKAKGEAARFSALYAEYQKAPQVTRQRLQIDALQNVLADTPKVFLDAQSQNNVMMLPLDKLISSTAAVMQSQDAALNPSESKPPVIPSRPVNIPGLRTTDR